MSLRQSFRALSLEAWSPVAGTETKTACEHQSLAPLLTPASAHCIDTGQPAYPTFLALCRSACQCVNTILELLKNTVPVSSSCTRFPLLFFLAVGGGTNGGSSSAKRQLPCIGGVTVALINFSPPMVRSVPTQRGVHGKVRDQRPAVNDVGTVARQIDFWYSGQNADLGSE